MLTEITEYLDVRQIGLEVELGDAVQTVGSAAGEVLKYGAVDVERRGSEQRQASRERQQERAAIKNAEQYKLANS